jgi:hypothetical protein
LQGGLDDAIPWPAWAQQHPQVSGLLVNTDRPASWRGGWPG